MTEIISVRFKNGGKEYYFNPNGVQYSPGQNVIIETSRGVEFGECTKGNTLIDEMTLVSPLRPALRPATDEDRKKLELNKKKEAEAFAICEKKIIERNLDMKLVEVEYNFEGSKILFFFTSDGRVDFRELVRDLASVFHTRIELRQIGVRDEAKLLGGLGICGRPFCCSSFLEDFQPVSIKMAKTQNLSLNPTKISGACGRLMCCLKYEQDAYEDALKRCPKNDSLVETPDGVGTIRSVNLLRETAKVRLDNAPDTAEVYACADLKIIRNGKGKRPEGYELVEAPEKAERPARTRLNESSIRQEGKNVDDARPSKQQKRKPVKADSEIAADQTENKQKDRTSDSIPNEKKNHSRNRPRKNTKKQGQDKPKADGVSSIEKTITNGKESNVSAEGGTSQKKPSGSRRNNSRRNHRRRPSSGNAQGTTPQTPKNSQ